MLDDHMISRLSHPQNEPDLDLWRKWERYIFPCNKHASTPEVSTCVLKEAQATGDPGPEMRLTLKPNTPHPFNSIKPPQIASSIALLRNSTMHAQQLLFPVAAHDSNKLDISIYIITEDYNICHQQ